LADDGRNTEVRLYGTIGGDLASLDKMIRKLQTTGVELRFVYEADPCGNEIYRHLRAHGLVGRFPGAITQLGSLSPS
jgi:transposase